MPFLVFPYYFRFRLCQGRELGRRKRAEQCSVICSIEIMFSIPSWKILTYSQPTSRIRHRLIRRVECFAWLSAASNLGADFGNKGSLRQIESPGATKGSNRTASCGYIFNFVALGGEFWSPFYVVRTAGACYLIAMTLQVWHHACLAIFTGVVLWDLVLFMRKRLRRDNLLRCRLPRYTRRWEER